MKVHRLTIKISIRLGAHVENDGTGLVVSQNSVEVLFIFLTLKIIFCGPRTLIPV